MSFDRKSLLIALLPFLFLAGFSLLGSGHVMDEYTYVLMARSYASGDFQSAPDQSRFPAFPFVLSLVYQVLPDDLLTGRLVSIAFGLVALLLLYFFVKEVSGEKAAFWSTILLGSSPFYLFFSDRVLSEAMFLALLVASVWLVYKSTIDKKWLIALGAVFSALVLTRFFGLYLAPIALVYWWGKKKFDLLYSKEFVLGAIAFVLVAAPWLYYSQLQTGSPIGLIKSFFSSNVIFIQGGFALADRIPSYLLVAPFLAGVGLLLFFLYPRKSFDVFLKTDARLFLIAFVAIAVLMELHGFLQYRLLRYLLPSTPFLAALLGVSAALLIEKKPQLPVVGKNALAALLLAVVAINFIASLFIIQYFYSLPKYAGYHRVGEFAAENCESHYSNLERILVVYTRKPQVDIASADCAVYSEFNPNVVNADFTSGRVLVYDRDGMKVYRKV